jgi:hypothetical protein
VVAAVAAVTMEARMSVRRAGSDHDDSDEILGEDACNEALMLRETNYGCIYLHHFDVGPKLQTNYNLS